MVLEFGWVAVSEPYSVCLRLSHSGYIMVEFDHIRPPNVDRLGISSKLRDGLLLYLSVVK